MIFRSPYPPVDVPRVTLHDFVLGGAAARGDAPALVDGTTGRVLTFAQLVDQTRCLAAGLHRRGISQGDVVAIWSPNSPEYAVVFHAVSRLGAILTTVNPTYTVEELAFQLKDAGACLIFTTAALLDKARAAVADAGRPIEIITIDAVDGVSSFAETLVDAEPPAVTIDPDRDLVVLPYSSGTTGLPKGVMLTHRNLVANLLQIDAMEPAELRALLGVLPFFHIYGMVVIMNHGLLRGAKVVTLPRFDLETVLRTIQDHQIALAHVVPPVVIAFAKHPAADAAVIGVPDDDCGEVPKAVIVRREPLTSDEVMAFVESHVAHYKRLRYVVFADAIPKSPSGKILRRLLRS